jgi:PhoH-like ATPase
MNEEQEDVYVVDTSVLINDPDVLYKLRQTRIFVPSAVVRELDGLKRSLDSKKSGAARKASRTLDRLGCREHIALGAITSAGSQVRIFFKYKEVSDLDSWADNRIVGAAMKLKEENRHYNVVLLSNDRNMCIITRAYGIEAENYPFSRN